MSESARDVPMADARQSRRARSPNGPQSSPQSPKIATQSLKSMLDDVHPPERQWTFHERTGVIYHAEKSKCDECIAYIEHMQSAKRREEPSLLKAIQDLESAWVDRLDDHPAVRERQDMAYRDGIAKGARREREEASEEGRARGDSGKSKERMLQAEMDLEELQEKHDVVVRANAVLVAEKRVVEQENQSLLAQIRTLEREFGRLSSGSGNQSTSTSVDVQCLTKLFKCLVLFK